MMTSRPVLNNVYFPQNKLLKRPNLLQNGNNTLQKKKKNKKQLFTVTSCIPTAQRQ